MEALRIFLRAFLSGGQWPGSLRFHFLFRCPGFPADIRHRAAPTPPKANRAAASARHIFGAWRRLAGTEYAQARAFRSAPFPGSGFRCACGSWMNPHRRQNPKGPEADRPRLSHIARRVPDALPGPAPTQVTALPGPKVQRQIFARGIGRSSEQLPPNRCISRIGWCTAPYRKADAPQIHCAKNA